MSIFGRRLALPEASETLPSREHPLPLFNQHFVHGRPLQDDFSAFHRIVFGMGCFWGAERLFWTVPGVYTTAVGYAGGSTENPSYKDVCSGLTGHAEVVLVVYEPRSELLAQLLKRFWEGHDPTQGMRQGNDVGTQYRSTLYCYDEQQLAVAIASRDSYQVELSAAGRGRISTEIAPAPPFFYAEDFHQQYLGKNPGGYCGLGGTGVSCPIGTGSE